MHLFTDNNGYIYLYVNRETYSYRLTKSIDVISLHSHDNIIIILDKSGCVWYFNRYILTCKEDEDIVDVDLFPIVTDKNIIQLIVVKHQDIVLLDNNQILYNCRLTRSMVDSGYSPIVDKINVDLSNIAVKYLLYSHCIYHYALLVTDNDNNLYHILHNTLVKLSINTINDSIILSKTAISGYRIVALDKYGNVWYNYLTQSFSNITELILIDSLDATIIDVKMTSKGIFDKILLLDHTGGLWMMTIRIMCENNILVEKLSCNNIIQISFDEESFVAKSSSGELFLVDHLGGTNMIGTNVNVVNDCSIYNRIVNTKSANKI